LLTCKMCKNARHWLLTAKRQNILHVGIITNQIMVLVLHLGSEFLVLQFWSWSWSCSSKIVMSWSCHKGLVGITGLLNHWTIVQHFNMHLPFNFKLALLLIKWYNRLNNTSWYNLFNTINNKLWNYRIPIYWFQH